MKSLRRVLVVQPFGIGDLLFITPILRALRLIPTVEKVDILLGSRTEEVMKQNPHIDEWFVIDKDLMRREGKLKSFKKMAALGKQLKANQYDLLLDYSMTAEYGFWSKFFLGIPRRAAYNYKNRSRFHNIRLALPEGFKNKHGVDYACELAEKAGVRVEDRFMEMYLDPHEEESAQALLDGKFSSGFLVVSPGGGESWGKDAHFKRWPVSYFADLIHRLTQETGEKGVVILGSAQEKTLGDELKQRLKLPSLNLAGQATLAQSAALIKKASLFIGNDGGLVHAARVLRTPLIAFYGPVDPVVYGPYPASQEAVAIYKKDLPCRPCYQNFRYNSACEKRECLQELSPDEVWAYLKSHGFFQKLPSKFVIPA